MKTPVLNTAIVVIVASMVLGMFATKSLREPSVKPQSAEAKPKGQPPLQPIATEGESQARLQQKCAEACARVLKVLEQERERWEDLTGDSVALLVARLEVGYLTDSQADLLRFQIRTLRRIRDAGLAQLAAIERLQELTDSSSRQSLTATRMERFKQLDEEWVQAATECNRQLKASGL
jgi:hypothetical protein